MYAVVAITPKGAEMVASVHSTERAADAEMRRQSERRGDLWIFVVRMVVLD
jgi:hypothetical protein